MAYDVRRAGALNYMPCRYGNSRVLFRGPQRRLDAPYISFIGGTETYGKFINAPFPALVESALGINCINFGIANAGVDVILNESFLLEAANGSRATVLQVIGAHNLSNRLYSVHPRRNDRFLQASPLLCSIYPEVDFSEFHFTKHMLSFLNETSPQRFEVVRNEVQEAWTARMKLIIRRIYRPVVLVWFADRLPSDETGMEMSQQRFADPLFVTRSMMHAVNEHTAGYVEVAASATALAAGTQGMCHDSLDETAARSLMGPKAHGEVAVHLGKALHAVI